MMAACEVGKNVDVEKPLANSINECDLIVSDVSKSNKVVKID